VKVLCQIKVLITVNWFAELSPKECKTLELEAEHNWSQFQRKLLHNRHN